MVTMADQALELSKRRHPDAAPRNAVGQRRFLGDDEALTRALQSGHPRAPAELFDRYGRHIQRVVVNLIGIDHEIPDLVHETFAQAFKSIAQLNDGARLKAWLTRIAVFTVRSCLRRRKRRRWLRFFAPEQVPEQTARNASPAVREAVQAMYAVLEQLPADLRLPFALRYVEGLELRDVAAACGVSLATIKRRLKVADARFVALAAEDPALVDWLQEGSRWTTP